MESSESDDKKSPGFRVRLLEKYEWQNVFNKKCFQQKVNAECLQLCMIPHF